jgi:hypothetical protein
MINWTFYLRSNLLFSNIYPQIFTLVFEVKRSQEAQLERYLN